MSLNQDRPIRVLVAKPGLDGHDVGAKLVCRALTDAGLDAIYSGLKRSPEEIARMAKEKDVDVVALSVLSGAHVPLTQKVKEELAAVGLKDRLLVVGGNIPKGDEGALQELGVAKVFPVGTPFEEIVGFLKEKVKA